MRIRRQPMLLLVAFSSLLVSNALLINYHVNRLGQYLDLETQVSELMKEQKALNLEHWMLRELGTYPRNASSLQMSGEIEALIFYSQDVSESDLKLKFDPLAGSLGISVTYLNLTALKNLQMLFEMCLKTDLPQPSIWQSYVIILNSSRIILLRLEQVSDEVFTKCVEYLTL